LGICINPYCDDYFCQDAPPEDPEHCGGCGAALTLKHRYRLLKLLKPFSQSQFVKVFEAEDLQMPDQPIIIKILDYPNPQALNALYREYLFLRQMSVPFLPVGLDDYFNWSPHAELPVSLTCLVLPKIQGLDSEQFIQLNGVLSQDSALLWFKQLLSYLAPIHESGYIHRDIKPANIIIGADQKLTLIDFGAIRKIDQEYLTLIGTHLRSAEGGTLGMTRVISSGFSAPEQIDGKALPQSDFFSMARTLVYWTTGKHPTCLEKDEYGQIIWRKFAPQLSRPFADFIDELMAQKARDRPKNIQEIIAQVDQLPHLIQRDRFFHSRGIKLLLFLFLASVLFGLYKGGTIGLSRYYYYRGSEQLLEGNDQTAKDFLNQAIKLDPTFADPYHNVALLCQRTNDLDCVLKNSRQVLKFNPNHWQTYYNLGVLYEDLGNLSEAEKYYQQSITTSKRTSVLPINNLARLNILTQRYGQAIALVQEGLQKTQVPTEQSILNKNLGWAYFSQGKYNEAITALTTARDLDPQLADSYCLLAKIYDRQKQTVEATNHWTACLSLNSNAKEVSVWRAEILNRSPGQ
jgi:serine/threonine protein kinase